MIQYAVWDDDDWRGKTFVAGFNSLSEASDFANSTEARSKAKGELIILVVGWEWNK